MNIGLLSNVNIGSLAQRLSRGHAVYTPPGFGTWAQELLDPDSALYRGDPQAVVTILDGRELLRNAGEDGPAFLDRSMQCIETAVTRHPTVPFFISNIDVPRDRILPLCAQRPERRAEGHWQELLESLTAARDTAHIFDLKKVVEDLGRIGFYTAKGWYLGGLRFSMNAEKALAVEIGRYLNALDGRRRKCLVVDLDNTLWGGLAGEDGRDGIVLSGSGEGARFRDFQQRIKELGAQGVVLAVASKNNVPDVDDIFRNHADMVLRHEDFAVEKIGWGSKAEMLAEIATELNLSADSFVFIDDNPVERAAVAAGVPGVAVPDFPRDTSELADFADGLSADYFPLLRPAKEDVERTRMYRENRQRGDARDSAVSYEEFLASLATVIRIRRARETDVARIVALVNKTNQFNLTTRRYGEKEIRDFMTDRTRCVWAADVEDRFGNNGTVAVVMTRTLENNDSGIDTFCMSCRVMGRRIEDRIVGHIEERARSAGASRCIGWYLPTAKNVPVADLYERLGYSVVEKDANGNKTYALDLTAAPLSRPDFAALIVE